MSHDIQLRNPQSLPASPDDVFAGGAPGAGMVTAPGAGGPSPAAQIHRMMRGRYGLAITLALIGGCVGAVAGWFSQRAEMKSEALLQIDPVIRGITNSDKVMYQYEAYLRSQPYNIMSPRVVDRAMNSEDWKKVGNWSPTNPDDVAKFTAAIEASAVRGTQNIVVGFTHPDAEVAQAGVRAVVTSYVALYQDMNGSKLREDLRALESKIATESASLQTKQQQVIDLSKDFGTDDLSVVHDARQQKMIDAEFRRDEAKLALQRAEAAMTNLKTIKSDAEKLTIEEIALADPTMNQYVTRLREQEFALSKVRFGPEHPTYKTMQSDIERTREFIDTLAKQYRERWIPPVNVGPNGQSVPLNDATLRVLQAQLDIAEADLKRYQELTAAVGKVRVSITQLNTEVSRLKQDLERDERTRDEKLVAAGNTALLDVVNPGGVAEPATDKRKQMAFVGFVGGGVLPVALMLLIGLMDRSYRYSEETTMDMSGVTLLGILPNLPDRLTDPDQAATAAHCVHQIRTMLQINSGGDDQQVYAVTSAQPGDGKTSLTLALALSFAASGSRTLLIDCDLVGAGLTARLDMGGPEGVLEAMTNRSLLEYIRQTDIADLAMLPVGSAQAHHAGLFSPAALRRLVTEAKKHFEVVLIDTGPILGSIEATPVCAAADAVILTVARGQQRPLVEKALQHLLSIGARFAGVVFNRAQTRDFERSISGMSLRSVARHQQQGANGNGHGHPPRKPQEKTFGPVARAVASSFNPPEGQQRDDG
jgi:capsular exopolysaccharide synthesis family protein